MDVLNAVGVIGHGQPLTQRAIIPRGKSKDVGDGRVWSMDVMWPLKVDGITDMNNVDEGTASLLKGLTLAIQPDCVFETGTHKGRSTAAFIEAMQYNNRGCIWTVDMDDYDIDKSGAIPFHGLHRLTKVVGRTPEVLSESFFDGMPPIDLALLDGDHEEESLRAEIEFVRTHAADNCVILFENSIDDGWPDVRRVIDEIFENRLVSLPTCTGLDMVQIKRAT
jgi:hypothetical protein